MPNWTIRNQRKITELVFFLLRRYHRTHGLSVVGWSRPPGNSRFSFHSLAVRHGDGRPKHLLDLSGHCSPTIYQDHPGLPAWGAGEQHVIPDWRSRDIQFGELLGWHEDRLSLRPFIDRYAAAIAEWRRTYLAEDAERHLLTWNVLGLFAAERLQGVWTYGRDQGAYGPPPTWVLEILQAARPSEMIHFRRPFVFHTDGRVLVDRDSRQVVDLWDRYLGGERPEHLALEPLTMARGCGG